MTDKWKTHCAQQPVPKLPNLETTTMTTKTKPERTEFEMLTGRFVRQLQIKAYARAKPVSKEDLTAMATKLLGKHIDLSHALTLNDPTVRATFDSIVSKLVDKVGARLPESRKQNPQQ